MISTTYDLNLTPGGVPQVIHVSQYDAASRTLVFNLFSSDGTANLPAGTAAEIRGTKPDGNGFSYAATLSGTAATVTITEQMTAVAGKVLCELVLYKGTPATTESPASQDYQQIATAKFVLRVERAALDKDTIPSESEIRQLVDVIDRTDEIIGAAETVQEIVDNLNNNCVAYNTQQALTDEEKVTARSNIGATGVDEMVTVDNTLTQTGEAADAAAVGAALAGKIDGAYADEEGYLILTIGGVPTGDRIGPFAGGGGGGGGSGNNAVMTMSNTSGWVSKTVAQGSTCPVSFSWSSLEDELPTGNGSMRITVGNSIKHTTEVQQGSVTVNIAPYLATGSNTVAITVSDIYGNTRSIRLTVTVVVLSLSSSFDPTVPYSSAISFPYTPVGNVNKTMHFILDGTQIGTASTTKSGVQYTFTIPQQTHGAHTLRCYFEATINDETVRSNELYYEFICLVNGNTTPIIISPFNLSTAVQYTSLNIGYTVYNPSSLTSPVTIKVNGTTMSEVTVDRTEHAFTYRASATGTLTIVISTGTQGQSGYASKTFTLTITESSINPSAVTENLALHLSSYGRSNDEAAASRSTWANNGVSASLTGFNWTSDGWQQDSQGITALRVSGDARVTIPYKIFETDFRNTGKTIEIEFATSTVLNYDSVILSCLSGGRGLSVTAQNASLASEQSSISMQFKEDEHVRVSFVVEKRSENRLIYCYVNGVMSGVVRYPEDDDFSQQTPVNISIGSNDCTMDIYCIRIYDNDLTRNQILDNWIADTQSVEDMVDRYNHNDVYDEYGNITIANLPSDLCYFVIVGDELPQYKGDKKTVSGYFVNPVTPSKNFTFTGAQIDVQGTSSQYYARKNYKIKFKNGFVLANGATASKYQHMEGDVPINVFCFKADVASSEGANNVELVRLYNSACPYRTPGQVADSRVKQGIDGFPMVIFWDNGEDVVFIGKYNFNADKSAEEFFGFDDDDESWEIKNNTSNRVLWKSADFTGTDWLNDFEARYPDTDPAYTDSTQLAEFAAWLVSTDRAQATGDALDESYTDIDGTVHTVDNAAYRLAKFKTEAANYMELDSAMFYYLFTELYLMVDSRAKNAFPSFMGSTINAGGENE